MEVVYPLRFHFLVLGECRYNGQHASDLGGAHRALAELYFRKGDAGQALEHAKEAEKLGASIRPSLRGKIFR